MNFEERIKQDPKEMTFQERKRFHKIDYDKFEALRKKIIVEAKDKQVIDNISKMNLEK